MLRDARIATSRNVAFSTSASVRGTFRRAAFALACGHRVGEPQLVDVKRDDLVVGVEVTGVSTRPAAMAC